MDKDQLVDEGDVSLVRASSSKQLMDFVLEALAISLATGRSDWTQYSSVVRDPAYVQSVWKVLAGMLRSWKADLRFVVASEIYGCIQGQTTAFHVSDGLADGGGSDGE